jgi:two-component system sensor histidine kinase/response regulator
MTEAFQGASILVVDDTPENLRLLTNMLAEHGYEVRPVTTGREALQAARHAPPELVLLDVNMPEMNGYEVCESLKNFEELKDIPVIFLTALTDTADKLRAFSAGGADYITKPFQIDEVLARVRTHLALRRARVESLQQYDQLKALEKLRDDLVHMVVHDMRSPLAVLICHLDCLETDMGSSPPAPSLVDLRAASQAAGVLNRMANDLLDVSRLEEGKLPLERKTNDLAKIAAVVRASMAGLDRSCAIEVAAPGSMEIACDGGIIQRVLENLVSNAIKHTPAGGRIRISVTPRSESVRVAVYDEGPGVPPDARTKIFEKFGTVAARQERKFHSAGLGLTFCKLAVEAHGGTIGVADGKPKGSVFFFDLPA